MTRNWNTLAIWLTAGGLFVLGWLAPQSTFAQASNGVLREVWLNISGTAVSDLTNNAAYPNSPSFESLQSVFEAPTDWSDYYGTRMRAWVLPPSNGVYYFWIASDDNGALFLSTNDTPAAAVRIAYVSSYSTSRQWTKEANRLR